MRFQQYIIRQQNVKQKAGVIPYYIDNNNDISILLMKPSNPEYGGFTYQIAKGNVDSGEDLKTAALREGKEELGLRGNNIGSVSYLGFKNIQDYKLHVYKARVINKEDFDEPHYETDSVCWFTLDDLHGVREEHKSFIRQLYGSVNEWKVHKSYSGRDLIKPDETVLWQYIPNKGLLHTYPDGTTYLDNKQIGTMIRSDDPKATHKKQLASFFNKLGFKEPNMRQWIEDNYETFVRGRIVDNDLYVYSSDYVGMEAKKYNKMADKVIDYIYDYVKDFDEIL